MGSSRSTFLLYVMSHLSSRQGEVGSLFEHIATSLERKAAVKETIAKSAWFYQNLPRRRLRSGLDSLVRALVRLDDRRQARHTLIVALEAHHDHALRRAPRPLDVVDRHPDHRPAGRDQHHLVPVADDACSGELALRLRQLNRLDTEAAAALAWVVGESRALAVAVLGHDENVALVDADNVGGDHLVALPEAHPLDPAGVAAHRPRVVLAEADRLPLART